MPARSTNRDDYQSLPRPIGVMAKDFPDGHVIPWHTHARHQLIYASAGVMRVHTPDGAWVVPPHRALWVPGGVRHEVRTTGAVLMRTLYVACDAATAMPAECRVVTVSRLLRELILRAAQLPLLYDEHGPEGRIMALILDELRTLPVLPLALPMPSDPRLMRLCTAILQRPDDGRDLAAWGRAVGASGRTLARVFQRETGLSFGRWRQQPRLLEALARLAQGQPVTTVALDLGYDSPSAFTHMFRRTLGKTPSTYFANTD